MVCLCGRVVSLWNGGVDLCWVEGCVVFTVCCLLFVCCGVCFSVVCVLFCCVVGCGMAVGCGVLLLVFFFFFLFVGVRGSARAALRARTLSPNTIVLLCCLVFSCPLCSSLFFVFRFSSVGMAVGDSPCVGVSSWHDGDG